MAHVGGDSLIGPGTGERGPIASVLDPPSSILDWESAWAPYDEATYAAALAAVGPDDVVVDIGAGDLRLALRLAAVARHVYAVERRPDVLGLALGRRLEMRDWRLGEGNLRSPISNLTIICADARTWPFPAGLTAGVLLMRHCRHFGLYVSKLRAVGARKLITNARWGMGVEVMDLRPGLAWEVAAATPGWYACACGAVGFIAGPPELVLDLEQVKQVEECPECAHRQRTQGHDADSEHGYTD